MDQRTELGLWVLVWVLSYAGLIFGQWRSKEPGAALPLIFAVNISIIHFFGALIYMLPWYEPQDLYLVHHDASLDYVLKGFRLSTIGIVGFVLGCVVLTPKNHFASFFSASPSMINRDRNRLPITLIVLGAIFFAVLSPLLGKIPSIGSVVTAGTRLVVVGLVLACWKAWHEGSKSQLMKWLGMTAFLPAITTTMMGFIGYGIFAALTPWLFVSRFYRPRWHIIAIMLPGIYFGLSLWVTYSRDRGEIRSTVWDDGQTMPLSEELTDRVQTVLRSLSNFEMFHAGNQRHLESIDQRLNQNQFIGNSVTYMEAGGEEFAHGKTIALAALSVIPRIIWSNKPMVAGGSEIIAKYTGREFSESASFGAGNVLEFYINFGTLGVFLGFAFFGVLIRYCDIRAGRCLAEGDWWRFAGWMVVGLPLINPGNNLSPIVMSVAAASIFVTLMHKLYFHKLYLTFTSVNVESGSTGSDSKRARRRPPRGAKNISAPTVPEPAPPEEPRSSRPSPVRRRGRRRQMTT